MKRSKGGKRRGSHVQLQQKNSSRRAKKEAARPQKRRKILGAPGNSGSKKVGQNKQFQFTYQHHYFKKRVNRRAFESPEFQAELLEEVKKFRKKHKTTKTRTIATIRYRHRNKYFEKSISIGRAEFGNVNTRVEDTMAHFRRLLGHYARQGFKFVRLKRIQLGKLTEAKKKKKRKK